MSEMKSQVLELANPRGVFRFCSIGSGLAPLSIEHNSINRDVLPDRFRSADVIGLFGLTLGNRVERRATELFSEGRYPEGYLIDVLGSYGLTELQMKLLAKAKSASEVADLRAGTQVQPGSRNWPLEVQQHFFELLPLEDVGIRMLDSLGLCPAKSKTFGCSFWRKT